MKQSFVKFLVFFMTGLIFGAGGLYLFQLAISGNNDSGSSLSQLVQGPDTNRMSSLSSSDGSVLGNQSSQSTILQHDLFEDPSFQQNSFEHKLAIYSYVAGLSDQQLANELQRTTGSLKQTSPSVLSEFQHALIEKLAFVNPTVAVKFVVAQVDQATKKSTGGLTSSSANSITKALATFKPMIQKIFQQWAITDTKGAISNAKSLNPNIKSFALGGILAAQSSQSLATYRDIAKELGSEKQGIDAYVMSYNNESIDDPSKAWYDIQKLVQPGNINHSLVLGNIALQWYQQEGLSVLDEINVSSLSMDSKRRTVQQVLRQAVKDDPQQAFQYALSTSQNNVDNSTSSTLNTVLSAWATSDPQAAYQAVDSIKRRSQRNAVRRLVVSIWARNEPYYFFDNLDEFPPSLHELGSLRAFQTIAQTSPREAAELADGQKLIVFGDRYFQIMQQWVQLDVESAVDWVANGPISEEKRHYWISALTTSLVSSAPRRAFELAIRLTNDENDPLRVYQESFKATIISRIAEQDLNLAVELLSEVSAGSSRSGVYASVGSKYIDEGESKKAIELGLSLSAEEQASYFQHISSSWAQLDPSGLVASIRNIPTADLRSSIALGLSRSWTSQYFTEPQLRVIMGYLSDSDRKILEQNK